MQHTAVIAFALALGGAPLLLQGGAEEADAQLARAQEKYEQGKYKEAQRIYRDLAKDYPDTEAGRAGARRSQPNAYLGHTRIVGDGPSTNRVDVVLMNDGYRIDKQKSWNKFAADLPREFERNDAFGEYFGYLNFVRCNLVSEDDNITGFGRTTSTALGGHVRGTIQGHVGVERDKVRAMLAELPADEHDGLVMAVVRVGVLGTGGDGIACIGGQGAKIAVHEWGHAFAALGDEYSRKTHEREGGRRAPNVSDTDDPTKVPWAHWIDAKARGIGVYEGANGQVRGAWKPKASGCVMQNGESFCEPCREAVVLSIYALVDPIESTTPDTNDEDGRDELVLDGGTLDFTVKVMQPESHDLDVSWYVLREGTLPRSPRPLAANATDRRSRGPLAPIDAKPDKQFAADRRGEASFRLRASDLDPGRYRVVVRVRDTTEFRGEKLPWVLKDDHGLLESERGWWVRVPE